jgi:hypothetical protein
MEVAHLNPSPGDRSCKKERARLKVGDRVAVVGRRYPDRVHIATVNKVTPQSVIVALTECWTPGYRIKDGCELSEFPLTRLCGLAMPKELTDS